VKEAARAGVTLTPIANNTAKARARLTIAAIMVAPPLSTHPARRQLIFDLAYHNLNSISA
jgi:hypothetical protein